MSGFVFADTFTEGDGGFFPGGPGYGEEGSGFGGFFGGMRGHHRRDTVRDESDREDYGKGGFFFGGPEHCYFLDEDREDIDWEDIDREDYREQWLEQRTTAVDEALEAGEISEEEALEYKEILEERSLEFEEEGSFQRGGGRGRGRSRGHMW